MAWLATYILEVTHNQVSINYIVENERMSIKPLHCCRFLHTSMVCHYRLAYKFASIPNDNRRCKEKTITALDGQAHHQPHFPKIISSSNLIIHIASTMTASQAVAREGRPCCCTSSIQSLAPSSSNKQLFNTTTSELV